MGGLESYQSNLLSSLEITSAGWKKEWETIIRHKQDLIKGISYYRKLEERRNNYEAGSAGLSQLEAELSGIKKDLRKKSAGIIKETQSLENSVYAYYSPFSVIFGTKYSYGRSEENERFRCRHRKLVASRLIEYKKRIQDLQDELAGCGYGLTEEAVEKQKQRRSLLSVVPEAEKVLWEHISEADNDQ